MGKDAVKEKRHLILMTTSRSFLAIDKNNEVTVIHRGAGKYFGIAKDNNNYIYVAARNSSKVGHSSEESGEILIFDSDLKFVKSISPDSFKMSDLHGITFWNKKLICTLTSEDALAIYDEGRWMKWHPIKNKKIQNNNMKDIRGNDYYHINSVYVADNKLYVLCHNWDEGSFILEFDGLYGEPLRKILNMGHGSHDIWKKDNKVFTLSSTESCVVSESGDRIFLEGFIRGIAKIKDYYYVGVSPNVRSDDRLSGQIKVQIYNSHWHPVKDFFIKDEGQVHVILKY